MKSNFFMYSIAAVAIFFVSVFTLSKTGLTNKNYVVLSESNTIVLSGEVNGQTVGKIVQEMREKDTKKSYLRKKLGLKGGPLYLFLNTPGGSIQSGMELIEILKGSDRQVNTVSMFAASMGFQLVQSLGERLVLENGVLMSHRAYGEFSGSFGGQNPSQLENRYNFWLSRIKELDQHTAERTKGKHTLEDYQKSYANELWLTGKQAVENGYADKVVSVKCDKTLQGVVEHELTFFGLRVLYDTDKCPLNTSPMNIRVVSPETERELDGKDYEDVKNKFLQDYNNKLRKVFYY